MGSQFGRIFQILLFLIFPLGQSAYAKTVCSMTLNSSDEIESFRKHLSPQGFKFIELTPNSKDPNWFKKACESGIKCDVLLISGHFGGLFFGQETSTTIDIAEMERASCRNQCDGILKNPKEVFLMGCNTLALQKKDHRTIEDYLNVLIEDGIPLSFAEEVAASRYSQQGFSLEKRFSAIFYNSKKLYGFSSTGPLGAAAGPRLSKYLTKIQSYSSHLDQLSSAVANSLLKTAFSGTSFQETHPTEVLRADSRGLFCALRDKNVKVQAEAVQRIISDKKEVSYFDSFASQLVDVRYSLENLLDAKTKSELIASLNSIIQKNSNLLTIKYNAIRVAYELSLINDEQRLDLLNGLVSELYSKDISFPRVTQICNILEKEYDVDNLSVGRIRDLTKKYPYFILTLSCVNRIDQAIKNFLVEKIVSPSFEYERTVALVTMKKFWTSEDRPLINTIAKQMNGHLKTRLYLSARKVLFPFRESFLGQSNIGRCVLNSENQGGQNLGTNWGCLTQNQNEIEVDICDHFADLNPDPENADDMRWYCWSNSTYHLLNQRPECYALAFKMGIRGNQMKMIWNCSHR
jgi:hypothetical protein